MRKTLLLGAGFSFDFGMPLAAELTQVFLELFNERSAAALANKLSRQRPFSEDRPINAQAVHEAVDLVVKYRTKGGTNYEGVLTELDALGRSGHRTQSDRDSYGYVISVLYDVIHRILINYQAISYEELYELNKPCFAGFPNLLSDEATWIFSLNHDVYVEALAIDLGIPITYGDAEEIEFPRTNSTPRDRVRFTYSEREALRRNAPGWITNATGINLVRLHGGFAELEYRDGSMICNPSLSVGCSSDLMAQVWRIESMGYDHGGKRVPSGRDRVVTGPDGTLDILSRSVLMGARKYSVTTDEKKGEEKLKLLEEGLDETDELTIIGYSFGDRHVNYRISNAMVRNPNLLIKIVDPVRRPRPEFLQQFDYNGRIRGGQCGAAQWMTFVKANRWDNEQTRSLKKNAAVRARIGERVRARLRC